MQREITRRQEAREVKRLKKSSVETSAEKSEPSSSRPKKAMKSTWTTETTSSQTISAIHGTSFPQTPEKRKVSDGSFGLKSTETTPQRRMVKEVNVQALQNNFIEDILDAVWGKQYILLNWVRLKTSKLIYTV